MNNNEKILSYLVVALMVMNCLAWFIIVQTERATSYSATAELQSQEILSLVTEMKTYRYLINETVTSSVGDLTYRLNHMDLVDQSEMNSLLRSWGYYTEDISIELAVLYSRNEALSLQIQRINSILNLTESHLRPDE